jgi:single-strand DNA-binding protein
MNDTLMTIVGNVVDEPRMRLTKNGHAVANFRVASTSRRFDRETGQWVDNTTLFTSVTCWRAMAENVHACVHKGQPIVVYGKYSSREYTVNETLRIAYDLEAIALGHDLSRGVTTFEKVARVRTTHVEADADGLPADRTDDWLGLTSAEVPDDLSQVAAAPEAVAVG